MNEPFTAGEPMSPPPEPTPPPRRRIGPPRRPRLLWLRRLVGLGLGVGLLAGAVAFAVGWHMYQQVAGDLPTLDVLHNYQPRVMSRVYADDDRLIGELATERRIFVPLTAIPDRVKQAFISAEDQKFWSHHGVDPIAILRAAWTDFQQLGQGRRPVGASTITQQVAKNMLLGSNEVSWIRKGREALLAMRIEDTLSKDRILELYLNEIYLGEGAYGVAAAAQTYFNKGLDELTVPEAAFLGALPKGPNNYNPFRFPEAARDRRNWVIDRMADDRALTRAEATAAKAEPIDPSPFRHAEQAPGAEWFGEEVRRQLVDKFGDQAMTSGLAVQTSLRPDLQTAADRVLRAGLMEYDRKHGGWRGPVARIEAGPSLPLRWTTALASVRHPAAMLPSWKLGVVLASGGPTAEVGWLDVAPGLPIASATPRTGLMQIGDTGWARSAHGAAPLGPTPRRMSDVVRPGDVVMVEQSFTAAPGTTGAGSGDRLILRQAPVVQGALVSMETATGRVLAMSGGWNYESSQFNRVTQAQRQPGSSFKPIVYLSALEQGVSPSQKFLDAPFVQDLGAQGVWRPNNYEMTFEGPTPLHEALEKSLNLVTIRVAERATMTAVAKTAIAFHVVDQMPRVLPAALGAVDTTVFRMAGAYASLAAGGREVIPSLIDGIEDRDGHVIYRAPGLVCDRCDDPGTQPKLTDGRAQLADPQSVFQIVTMMEGVVNRGTGTEAGRGMGRWIAGKTGTSQDFNDAWFVGFTPDIVTAVWVGFDQPASLGDKETGGFIAAPIWHDYMETALRDRPKLEFRMPQGVTMARWDTGSGSVVDAFKPGQVPGAGGSGGDTTADADAGSAAGGGEAPPGQPSPGSGGGGASVDSGMGGLY